MKVLIADDDPIACRVLEQAVSRLGHAPVTAVDGTAAWATFQREAPDVVISDWYMPGLDGLELSRRVRASPGESYVYIILITGSEGREKMLEAMEAGADDFLPKPVDPQEIAVRLLVASRITSLYRRTQQAEERLALLEGQVRANEGIDGMIGRSDSIRAVVRRLRLAARGEVTVLLTGESGTGKEIAARALHSLGARRDGPFIAINCAAIPDTLLESELFGHVKGSFTGAQQNKTGLFEAARGGSLFLDEIGDVSPALQVKLLRALQEKEIRRVGDEQVRKVDARIITATNKDLKKLVSEGKIREDFYYRIRVFEIALPSLRDRRDDIPLLASHFMKEIAESQGRPVPRLSREALRALLGHSWPGNIRELRNTVEHALVVAENDTIRAEDLPIDVMTTPVVPATASDPGEDEAQRISEALRVAGGNRVEASKQLGISRVTLWKKMKRLGLLPES